MLDKNNVEIKTGDIVEVTGAYFKNDNGLWVVVHSPGDKNWLGADHCLKKITKKGKLRTCKGTTGFWPIGIFTNDHFKRLEGNKWNKQYAQIEVRKDIQFQGELER